MSSSSSTSSSTSSAVLLSVLSILVSSVAAAPFQATNAGQIVNLARGTKTQAPVTDYDSAVFDPTYPQEEIAKVLTKYKNAAWILQHVGLGDVIGTQGFDANSTNAKRQADLSGSPLQTKSQMPLTDFRSGNLDVLYYGPLQFGSTKQRLTVDIDTGSADLWVPVNCGNNGCDSSGYNAAASSTYRGSRVPFEVTYGSGTVSGTLAQDRVTLGSLSVPDQYFGAVTQESEDFETSPNDGLIGMAFSSIASSGKPTFFENLMSSNKVSAPLFGVHLARGQVRGSQLCLGCWDSSKATGAVVWVPVISKTYWAVSMPSVAVNGRSIPFGDVTAAIDTGTTLVYFPAKLAEAFYRMIPGSQVASQYGEGFYTYPCSTSLNIAFQLGANMFRLNIVDFNLGRTSSGSPTCVGGILALGSSFPHDLTILGDLFLKSWYSVYDYSNGARVGFAPSINNS